MDNRLKFKPQKNVSAHSIQMTEKMDFIYGLSKLSGRKNWVLSTEIWYVRLSHDYKNIM